MQHPKVANFDIVVGYFGRKPGFNCTVCVRQARTRGGPWPILVDLTKADFWEEVGGWGLVTRTSVQSAHAGGPHKSRLLGRGGWGLVTPTSVQLAHAGGPHKSRLLGRGQFIIWRQGEGSGE